MTIKQFIKQLQEFNMNAEVRVLIDRKTGDTTLATIIREIDEEPKYIGFTSAGLDAKQTINKKKYKKVVIA